MRLPSSASHRRYPLLPIKHERREFLCKRRPAHLLLRMSVAGGNRRAGMADRRLLGSLTSTFSIPPTSAGRLALDGLPRPDIWIEQPPGCVKMCQVGPVLHKLSSS